jgi:transcriptional regulator with XRE-family HTH domain
MQTQSKKPHVGRNIQTIRYIRGISQADLGVQLEERLNRPFSQQLISDIEGRENVEDEELLKQIAEILKVEPEALRNMDLNEAINIFGNSFSENSTQQINYKNTVHNQQTYNPLDKLIELFEKEKAELKAEIERLKNAKGKR